jgi:predicted phosphodiesterase
MMGSERVPQETPDFAFGVVADAQYCDAEPQGSRYYRASPQKLASCVKTLNQMDLAFTVHLGDLIDRDIRSFDVMTPIFKRLKAPGYHVLGNHDFSVAPDELDDVVAKLEMPDRHYSFRVKGWRFVVLDGNDLSLFARPKGSPEYEKAMSVYRALKNKNMPQAHTWNGGIGNTQREWLQQQLDEADTAGEQVIVLCHFPAHPENAHNLWNDKEIVRLLESHSCVTAYLNGHNHAGNYGQFNGVHFVTFPGMVESPDTTAYAVVEVRKDQLRINGYGRTPSRSLAIR